MQSKVLLSMSKMLLRLKLLGLSECVVKVKLKRTLFVVHCSGVQEFSVCQGQQDKSGISPAFKLNIWEV